jgi:hypothetical protein
VKGIIIAFSLVVVGATLYIMVRYFQRELAKLHAMIVKGERHHDALRKKPGSVRHSWH